MAGVVGTVSYCAPEVLRDDGPYGGEVDMFSLGAIAYTLLAGYNPFDPTGNGNVREVRWRVLTAEWDFTAFPQRWAHVSASAKLALRAMLCADPRKRMQPAQLLRCRWLVEAQPKPLPGSDAALRAFNQNRQVWREAIEAVWSTADAPGTLEASSGADVLSPSLCEDSVRALHRVFSIFDRDTSGFVKRLELEAILSKLELLHEETGSLRLEGASTLPEAFAAGDADGDGRVSFDEFLQIFIASGGGSSSGTNRASPQAPARQRRHTAHSPSSTAELRLARSSSDLRTAGTSDVISTRSQHLP